MAAYSEATLVPLEEYLSTSWDPDRDYVEGRVCGDKVETADGAFSIPLSEIFAGLPATEE